MKFSAFINEMMKPRWELPPEPGTAPIPDGHVRLYHQTDEKNLDLIRHQGIRYDKARAIEGPAGIYADEKGFYGKPRETPTVEFSVPKDRWDRPFVVPAHSIEHSADETKKRDTGVPQENIIAIHHPWHIHARYIDDDEDLRKEVINGEHDNLLHEPGYGQAIRFIKHKYANK